MLEKMRSVWCLLLVGASDGLLRGQDDLYLEGKTSGDLPVDDEDGEDVGSGSGSGDYACPPPKPAPVQTGGTSPRPKTAETQVLVREGADDLTDNGEGSRMFDVDAGGDVTSENLWERTERCAVVGVLCASLLLLFLAYRMKKKDEGSYDLGDTKLTTTAYRTAPTREFYA
ncbi:syndecan-2-B-like [Lampetra planeri]